MGCSYLNIWASLITIFWKYKDFHIRVLFGYWNIIYCCKCAKYTVSHISFWILINNFYLILLMLLLMVLVSTFASSFRKFFTKCSTWLKQVLANLILQVCKYRVVLMRGSWKLLNKVFVLASFCALTIRQQWPLLIGLFSWNSFFHAMKIMFIYF